MVTTMVAMVGMRAGLRRAAWTSAAMRRQILACPSVVLQSRVHAAAVLPMPSYRGVGSSSTTTVSPWFSHVKAFSSSANASDDASSIADSDKDERSQEPVLVYEGPMARAVRLMKGVSVTSCILTSIGMPTLCLISEQSTSMVGKWAMCGTIMLFGLGTTTLFHVLFKPYVMRMWIAPSANTDNAAVTVETVTLFAQLTKHEFELSDVSPPASSMHPMLSFQARGKNFFVHPEEFEDRALAEKLLGKKILAPRKDDDDDDDE